MWVSIPPSLIVTGCRLQGWRWGRVNSAESPPAKITWRWGNKCLGLGGTSRVMHCDTVCRYRVFKLQCHWSQNQKSFNINQFLLLRHSKISVVSNTESTFLTECTSWSTRGQEEKGGFGVYLFYHVLFFFLAVLRCIKYITVKRRMHIVWEYINTYANWVCIETVFMECIHDTNRWKPC